MVKSFNFYFNLIYNYYGIGTAKRSKVPLMAHIIEGVNVLKALNASDDAIKAFMIHPIFQDDFLVDQYRYVHAVDAKVMLLVMEYRAVANAYSSNDTINSIGDIQLSCIEDVNKMLVADKVQSYKDFLAYHKDTHPRSQELDTYFQRWLAALNARYRYDKLVVNCYNTSVTLRIKNEDKYLLLNRYNSDRTYVGQCHPGGKVDVGETLFDALAREVKEEIGVDIDLTQIKFFDVFFAETKKGVKSVFTFETEQIVSPVLNTAEFDSLEWVDENQWNAFWNSDITVDYEKHNFYGVDIDNTVLYDNYPGLGDFIPGALEALQAIVADKTNHIIIWTMRDSSQHSDILALFKDNGIRVLSINEHLTQHEWTDSPKLYADFFIEDREINAPKNGKAYAWLK